MLKLLVSLIGARDRNRTGTPVIHEAADFKSDVSTYFTTRAMDCLFRPIHHTDYQTWPPQPNQLWSKSNVHAVFPEWEYSRYHRKFKRRAWIPQTEHSFHFKMRFNILPQLESTVSSGLKGKRLDALTSYRTDS